MRPSPTEKVFLLRFVPKGELIEKELSQQAGFNLPKYSGLFSSISTNFKAGPLPWFGFLDLTFLLHGVEKVERQLL